MYVEITYLLKGQFKIHFMVDRGDQKASLKYFFILHLDCSWTLWMPTFLSQAAKNWSQVPTAVDGATETSILCLVSPRGALCEERHLNFHCLKYFGAENCLFFLVRHCSLKETIHFHANVWWKGFSLIWSNIYEIMGTDRDNISVFCSSAAPSSSCCRSSHWLCYEGHVP